MKNNLLYCVAGLFIGLVIGFIAANKLNRPVMTALAPPADQSGPPFQGQQVDSVAVKDQGTQGAMMPEVQATLKKATDEPQNFDAQKAAGEMFVRIRNYPRALEYFEAANKIKPDDREMIVAIGNTYFDSGQYEKAEGWYEQALKLQPIDVNVRTDLGITFVERQNPDLDRGIAEFRKSLETDPNHEPTLYNLAIALYQKGDKAGAQDAAARLEKVNPQSELVGKLRQVIK